MSISKLETDSNQVLESIVTTILQRSAERSPDLAHAVVYCSVPRWFDAEVIAGLRLPGEALTASPNEILQQLRDLPFCQPHPTRDSTWVFSKDFRVYLLSRKEVTDR